MLMDVMNVVKIEKPPTVIVLLDMLKSMESVNLVTTIVRLVPLQLVLVLNVMIQESKK